jgi:hypothetical protein
MDEKREFPLKPTIRFWHKEMIYKSGRIESLAMDRDELFVEIVFSYIKRMFERVLSTFRFVVH